MYNIWIDDYHQQWVQFLRPLTMTCRAMRLRLLPWVWERLELPRSDNWNPGGMSSVKLNIIADVLHASAYLAATVKYFFALLCPRVGADSRPLKDRNGMYLMEQDFLSSIYQMPTTPSKSSHARDRMGGRVYYGPTQERSQLHRTPPD